MHCQLTAVVAALVVSLAAIPAIPAAEPAAADKPIEAVAPNLGHPVDFEKDVYPILESNCLACHNAGINESKFNVETAEMIRNGGRRGPAVVPKDPAKSLLFQFASRAKQPAMPPLPNKVEANALSPKELGIVKQWILEGCRGGAGNAADSIQWQPIPARMKSIMSVSLSPWGRFVAAGRTNQIVIYDTVLGKEVAKLADPALSDVSVDGHSMYPGGAADRDFIHALAFSPDGTLLAAGGYRVVKIWKRPRNVRKLSLTLPQAATTLAASPDGSLIAVGTAAGAVQLLSTSNGKAVRSLSGPAAAVTGLAFSADGKLLFGGSLDKSWRSWTVADGVARQTVQSAAPINAIALSHDSKTLITAGADGVIRVWPAADSKNPSTPRQLTGHQKSVTSLALIGPAGTKLLSGSEDGSVRIWDLGTGKPLLRVEQGGPVTAVAARPDGNVIASAGSNRLVRLWQVADGKPIAELQGDLIADRAVVMRTESLAIAGQHIAAADARIKTAEQEVKDRTEGAKKAAEAKTAATKAAADANTKEKSADAALAAATKSLSAKPTQANLKQKVGDAAKALAAATLAAKTTADTLTSAVRSDEAAQKALGIAKDRLAETRSQKKLAEKERSLADGELTAVRAAAAKAAAPIRTLAFSADGKTLATSGDDGVVHLWDAQQGRPLETFRKTVTDHAKALSPAEITRLVFVGSSTVVSAATDKSISVWDINPAWTLLGRIGTKPETPLDTSTSPFVGRVLCLDFNRAGTLLVTGGGEPSRSGELKIWNIPSLTLARDLKDAHSDTVFGVEFSRDGKDLASCAADKFVKLSDVATGKLVRSFEGHTHQVLGVTWQADGSTLASAGADNVIKVWNVETGEQSRTITGCTKQVTSIQSIGTGDEVVSSSGDKTVRVFRTNDGGNILTLAGGTDFVYSAAATRDKAVIAAGGEDGVLRLWNGKTGQLLFSFDPPQPAETSAQASAAKR